MKRLLFSIPFTIACGSKNPPPASPAPEPTPQRSAAAAPTPAPAPTPQPAAANPAPAPAPSPARDDRGEVLAILDKIDHQLKECENKKMHHVHDHAESVVDLVKQLDGPIAAFPQVSRELAKLKTQAAKFEVACKKNDHKDQHHHHHELADVVTKIRKAI